MLSPYTDKSFFQNPTFPSCCSLQDLSMPNMLGLCRPPSSSFSLLLS